MMPAYIGLIIPTISIIFVLFTTLLHNRNLSKTLIISFIYGLISLLFVIIFGFKFGKIDIFQAVFIGFLSLPYLGIVTKFVKQDRKK